MTDKPRCTDCGATSGAWEWRKDKMVKVKLVAVGDVLLCQSCERKHRAERQSEGAARQLPLF